MGALDDLVLLLVDQRLLALRKVAPEEEGASVVLLRDDLDDAISERLPTDLGMRSRLVGTGRASMRVAKRSEPIWSWEWDGRMGGELTRQ